MSIFILDIYYKATLILPKKKKLPKLIAFQQILQH